MKQTNTILLLLLIVAIGGLIYITTANNEHYDSISNKFAFIAGPISKVECQQRCSQRYTDCMSYGNENANWCKRLYNDCQDDCSWNEQW